MTLTLLRHATQKPPPGPVKVDWGHPLANGLVGLYLCNELGSGTVFDVVSGTALTLANGPVWSSSQGVPGLLMNSNNAGAYATAPTMLRLDFPITVVWKGWQTAQPSTQADWFGVVADTNNTTPWRSYGFETDQATLRRLAWNDGSNYQFISATYNTNGPTWYAGTLAQGAQAFYINDPITPVGTNTLTGQHPGYNATAAIQIGVQPGNTGKTMNMLTECGHIYARALNPSELAWLKTEPYCMVQRRPIQRWFVVVAGGGGVTHPVTVSTTQNQSVSLQKQADLIRSLTQAQSVALAKTPSLTRSVTQSQTVALPKQVTLTRSITQAQAATIQKQANLTRSTTQAQTVSLAWLKVILRTVSTTQAQVATLGNKTVTLARTVAQPQTLARSLFITLTRALTQAQHAVLSTGSSGPPSSGSATFEYGPPIGSARNDAPFSGKSTHQ